MKEIIPSALLTMNKLNLERIEQKRLITIKNVVEPLITMIKFLWQWKPARFTSLFMLIMLLVTPLFTYPTGYIFIFILQMIAFIICIPTTAAISSLEKGKHLLTKNFCFSILWFAASVVLIEANTFNSCNFDFIKFIQYYTSFLFIFAACLIPDSFSTYDPQTKKNQKEFEEMKEKISTLEKEVFKLKKA